LYRCVESHRWRCWCRSVVVWLALTRVTVYHALLAGTTSVLGKAPLADLKSGLATAPTLFAAEEFPKLLTLIGRKFEAPGDVDEALVLVKQSQGLRKCKELAQVHAERAIEAISVLEPSPARDSLIALACKVVTRTY
jgi:geranylgeranyl pyrophosphate synthase